MKVASKIKPINGANFMIADAEDIAVGNTNVELVLRDLVNGNISKLLGNKLKGASIYLSYKKEVYGNYTDIIDKLISDGCNAISICPILKMQEKTSNELTRIETDDTVLSIFQYAKGKGLKTMLKCHVDAAGSSGHANINPTDTSTWIKSLHENVCHYVSILKDYVDIVSLTNECRLQTNQCHDEWKNFNDEIKNVNSNIKTTSAATVQETKESVLWDIVDLIGCNLYSGINGTVNQPISQLKPLIFRDCHENNENWIDVLNDLSIKYGKNILITEVGILPYENNLKSPADWTGQGDYNEDVQCLYYNLALNTYLNSSTIKGTFIWSACDGFTFLGRKAESVVKQIYGGEINV